MLSNLLKDLIAGPILLLLLIFMPTLVYLLIRFYQEINTQIRGVEVIIKKNNWDAFNRFFISLYALVMPIVIHVYWRLDFYEKGPLVASLFGIFCFISAYMILYYFDPQIGVVSRLRYFTGQNIIGEFTNVLDSKQIDCFRERVLTSLVSEKRPLIIACSSYGHGEGKSILAASLAKSFSRLHSKVLLMELDPWCDLPNRFVPSSQRNNVLGISDYVIGECELGDTLYFPMEECFAVIPRGNKVDKPYEMLNSPLVLGAIEHSLKEFAVIIIDAPTISQFPELNSFLLNKGVLLLTVSHNSKTKQLSKITEYIKRFALKNKTGLILTRNT